MHSSKLIQFISLFSKQELQQFKDFVHSPYFNKHDKTKKLLDYILKVKNWDSAQLNKRTVFKKLFPGQEFEEQLLANVTSYLLSLLRRFYTQKQQERGALEGQLNLLEYSLDRGQEKLFLLSAGKLKKQFEQSNIRDSHHFLRHSRYEQLMDDFDLKYGKRVSGNHLSKALSDFDQYFIGNKLKMTCQMLARQQVTGQKHSFILLEQLIHFLENDEEVVQNIPSIGLYYLIYKMMTQEDTSYYFQLKERLKTEAKLFQHSEGRDLYTHALNYCIKRINFGEPGFRKETFELYQQMLDNGLLLIENQLPQWDYTNIVSLGCDLKEYEWISQFIHEQKPFLPEAVRENTFTYNLAALHYNQKEYDSAITLLQQVEFTEVFYNLLTRILMLKIYFDNQNWRALEYTLETFRIYLLRNKQIEEKRRKSGLNLLRFTKRLFRILEEKSILSNSEFDKKMNALKQQITSNKLVLNRAWLLQKFA